VLADEPPREFGVVLGAFDGAQQRFLAAGQQHDQPVHRPSEGRQKLCAVLHREPPRRAGTGVDETAAVPQPRLERQRSAFESRAGRVDRGHRRELPFDHGIEHLGRFPPVDG
jgi:hypothetical protein